LSLKNITLKMRINSTSTFRFIETLIQLGYLKKDPMTKLIRLGPTAMVLSQNINKSFDILQIVKPYIDEAFERFNVTIDSGIVQKGILVDLYRREVKDTLVFKMPMLSPHSHCTALGKAYLSGLREDARSRILDGLALTPRTPHSLTNRAAILADLRKTRKRRYSINNEEYVVGLISIGAPLINSNGDVLGAVSFDVTTFQFALEEAEKRFGPAVLQLAKEIQPMLPL
jgi:IclR family pca regulon transcriptional regulator